MDKVTGVVGNLDALACKADLDIIIEPETLRGLRATLESAVDDLQQISSEVDAKTNDVD